MVGGITSIGQSLLPYLLAPAANSAGTWVLSAFALCLVNRMPARGLVLGALALFAMVIGYALVSELRGFTAGARLVLFWGAASVVVGPFVGTSAAWVRGANGMRPAIGAGIIGGVLIGEAVYGLTLIAETTPAGYWAAELVAGLVVVVAGGRRSFLAALAVAAAAAAAVNLAYRINPLSFL